MASNLNINTESLPNLVVYVPSKDLYASLIGTFDDETINGFLDKVVQGRVNLVSIEKIKMELMEKKCEEIKEMAAYVEDSEDDEILREIIEEEKKKREEFEKERESMDGEKKKKKKKKKKDL